LVIDPIYHLHAVKDPITYFENDPWAAGVIGLGYVGLPLLLAAAARGLGGVGYDVAETQIENLRRGQSHVDDVSNDDLSVAIDSGVEFSSDPSLLSKADTIFICVPSPLGRNRQPDLSYIESAAETVASVARPGQLICLESTTYPGTTEDYLLPAIEKAGLKLDVDVWLAFSPERVSPGEKLKTAQIPKVIGGVSATSGKVAAAAYRRIVPDVHLVSSARTAEMSKLLENTYRAINIGLVNEMAQLCHELDIDIWEVIEAAATKPFGFQPFYPGPGVGGHCIPLDPQYLAWRAREANFETRFIETADHVNSKMPEYTVQRVADLLNVSGHPVKGSRILVLGIAYKPDISDDRESASVEVAKRLLKRGAEISVIDPFIGSERIAEHGFIPIESMDLLSEIDIAVVLTDHSETPYEHIANAVPVVFDARGVFRRLGILADNVESL
jgi:UDP-N-acetyl-D-glucosamine dehydrogenase